MKNDGKTYRSKAEMAKAEIRARLGDVRGPVQSDVSEIMNVYLETALDVVCNGDALDCLLGDLDGLSDAVIGAVGSVVVAGYLQGCATLHAGAMQGGKHAGE